VKPIYISGKECVLHDVAPSVCMSHFSQYTFDAT